MVGIVETFHAFFVFRIEPSGFEILHRGIHVIIVVRIVLESIDLVGETVIQRLPEVDIRFMGIERSVGIGGIEEPVTALFIRHDIDHAADGIRPEADRNNAFVDFDAFSKIDRDIVQRKRIADSFLRHAVDKHLHMFSAESVQHQLHIRSDTARLTEFHPRRFRKGIAQALGRVLKFFGVYRDGVEGRTFQTAYPVGNDDYFIQFFYLR